MLYILVSHQLFGMLVISDIRLEMNKILYKVHMCRSSTVGNELKNILY